MITPFRTARFGDKATKFVQDSVATSLRQVLNKQILDGVLVEGIEFSGAGSKDVLHKLGRKLVGWIVVNKTADANVWQPSVNSDNNLITLQVDAAVTISIWVF